MAEKVSALLMVEYLAQSGQQGSCEQFNTVLEKACAAAAPPDEADRLPADATLHID